MQVVQKGTVFLGPCWPLAVAGRAEMAKRAASSDCTVLESLLERCVAAYDCGARVFITQTL